MPAVKVFACLDLKGKFNLLKVCYSIQFNNRFKTHGESRFLNPKYRCNK